MKSILLLILSLSFVGVTIGQEVLFVEDFDNYTNGENVAAQSAFITTWSLGTGPDDAPVTQEQANSGTQSIKIEGASDLLVPFDNLTTGIVDIEFSMYVQETQGGYFNVQKTSTPGTEWAFEVYIGEQSGSWHIAGGDTTFFDYPLSAWNDFDVSIDLNAITATLSLNDELITTWGWNQTPTATTGLNQVGGLNIYAGAPAGMTASYYIDDLSASYTAPVSIEEADVNEPISIYPNPASDQISIALEAASTAIVTIRSASGKIVMNDVINNKLSTIDVSRLESGIYFVEINDEANLATSKLVIR